MSAWYERCARYLATNNVTCRVPGFSRLLCKRGGEYAGLLVVTCIDLRVMEPYYSRRRHGQDRKSTVREKNKYKCPRVRVGLRIGVSMIDSSRPISQHARRGRIRNVTKTVDSDEAEQPTQFLPTWHAAGSSTDKQQTTRFVIGPPDTTL